MRVAAESPPVAPIRITISYRRDDSRTEAIRLHESLKRQFGRQNVFRDVDSIPLGGDWRAAIRKTVSQSDVLLALIGNQWLTISDARGRRLDDVDDVLRFELELALKKKGARVIPILLDGTAMPSADDLPEGLKGLAGRQSFRIDSERWSYEVRKLTRELKSIQAAKAGEPSKKKTPKTKGPPAPQGAAGDQGKAKRKTPYEELMSDPWARFTTVHKVGDVVVATVPLTYVPTGLPPTVEHLGTDIRLEFSPEATFLLSRLGALQPGQFLRVKIDRIIPAASHERQGRVVVSFAQPGPYALEPPTA